MSAAPAWLPAFQRAGIFSDLDLAFARFLCRVAETDAPELALSASLVSRQRRMGHVCLTLDQVDALDGAADLSEAGVRFPPPSEWAAALRGFSVVGMPGAYRPLVLDDRNRLYLYRFWEDEQQVAAAIRNRVAGPSDVDARTRLVGRMARYFPPDGAESGPDWQQVAAFVALTRRFCVITGGPGTGKTTTVARILALLKEREAGGLPTALAAPTGKAAARLTEAIRREAARLPAGAPDIGQEEAVTLHRLLGARLDGIHFRYNAENRLPVAGVVVDEASMVDLSMMARLVKALPDSARLILLGDKDQLASVEAGAVLGDICDAGTPHAFSAGHCRDVAAATEQDLACSDPGPGTGIRDAVVALKRNYRFGAASGIGAASRAVNGGDIAALDAVLSGGLPDLAWRDLPRPGEMAAVLAPLVRDRFAAYLKDLSDPARVHERFNRFRILCALRRGPYGAAGINRLVTEMLARAGLIQPRDAWYPGRPVMVTQNHYGLGLFNGDVGITIPTPGGGAGLRVCFPKADGSFRLLSPVRVPAHETVFAMTVHKSQGSEFGEVLLMLPDGDTPLLTRELVYTGITRAARRVVVWGKRELLEVAVRRRIVRLSGLRDALWGDGPH